MSDTFDGVFFITITGAIIGFLGLLIKQCFKSKCTDAVFCWGLINIKRDVITEEKENEFNIEHGIINDDNSPNQRVNRNNPL
jgi:hypothetical protein